MKVKTIPTNIELCFQQHLLQGFVGIQKRLRVCSLLRHPFAVNEKEKYKEYY